MGARPKIQTKQFTMKLPPDLISAFHGACESNDMTASQEIRKFMREYVRKHGQGDLFRQPTKPKPRGKKPRVTNETT